MSTRMTALLLGIVAGLRTFTAPAALQLARHRGPAAYALGVLAILEYGADLSPRVPARTSPGGMTARVLSGAFCGWTVTADAAPSRSHGAALGGCGAVIGAYLGLAARTRAISSVGRIPAALMEDGAAIAGAILIVGSSFA